MFFEKNTHVFPFLYLNYVSREWTLTNLFTSRLSPVWRMQRVLARLAFTLSLYARFVVDSVKGPFALVPFSFLFFFGVWCCRSNLPRLDYFVVYIELLANRVDFGLLCFINLPISPYAGVMGCGAAEATGLAFFFFFFVNPHALSANRVESGFCFINFPFYPTSPSPPFDDFIVKSMENDIYCFRIIRSCQRMQRPPSLLT